MGKDGILAPSSVEDLAGSILVDPVRVDVAPTATTVEKVEQHVLMVPKGRKRNLLEHVLKDRDIKRVLIFTRTKHGANKVAKHLDQLGVSSSAIHGNKSQNARQKALNDFRSGTIRALVATDVAARGIDVDGVTHVINFEIPNEPESYVHRIGRTARAGAAGVSLSFCDHEERAYMREIEKTIRQKVPLMVDHPYHFEGMEAIFDDEDAREAKTRPRSGAPKRRANSGKHKPNRRIKQPHSHGNKSKSGGHRKGRSATDAHDAHVRPSHGPAARYIARGARSRTAHRAPPHVTSAIGAVNPFSRKPRAVDTW